MAGLGSFRWPYATDLSAKTATGSRGSADFPVGENRQFTLGILPRGQPPAPVALTFQSASRPRQNLPPPGSNYRRPPLPQLQRGAIP